MGLARNPVEGRETPPYHGGEFERTACPPAPVAATRKHDGAGCSLRIACRAVSPRKPDMSQSSDAKCPLNHAAGGGTSNRDWWPNRLRIEVLHQRSHVSNPMDKDFNY